MSEPTNFLLAAAIDYASRGWNVLPIYEPEGNACSCKNPGCRAIGKHPRIAGGFLNATTDHEQIRAWWTRWPAANIGVRTGAASGLIVIDVDNKNDKNGSASLAASAAPWGGMVSTLTAITGSGEHLFFKHPGDAIKGSVGKMAEGVDVRADGGYVVAPPSLHVNGNRYRWLDFEMDLADLPLWLMVEVTGEESKNHEIEEKHNAFTDAPVVNEGERNDTLFKLGSSLRGQHGKSEAEIAAILLEYNVAKCNPPLNEPEVHSIVKSVCNFPVQIAKKKSTARLDGSPLYWFQFNTRDWFANQNVTIMTDAQTGWYIRLKAYAWDKGGFLPADIDKLWKLAKAPSRKRFERDCDLVLDEFVHVIEDGEPLLKHPEMAAEYANKLELWMKKKDAGDAAEEKRRQNAVTAQISGRPEKPEVVVQ